MARSINGTGPVVRYLVVTVPRGRRERLADGGNPEDRELVVTVLAFERHDEEPSLYALSPGPDWASIRLFSPARVAFHICFSLIRTEGT
jgi:hypothetical protein